MSDDNKNNSFDERISRARERMSTDYDDAPPPRRPVGAVPGKTGSGGVLGQFLSSDSGTRKLVYSAAGLGGLLVIGIGSWALLGHHQSGIPVMGPPPVSMRTKPVDPGGMQLDGVSMPEAEEEGQAHPVPAPEKPNPSALAAQYGQQAASTDAATKAKEPETPTPPADETKTADAGSPAADGSTPATPAKTGNDSAPAAATPEEQQPTSLPDTSEGTTDESAAGDAAAASGATATKAPAKQQPAPPAAPATRKDVPAPSAATSKPEAALPAPVPAASGGKYKVQLAALQSEAQAQQEWSRLKTHYPTLFADKSPVVEKVQRDNAVFYRLRVSGFASNAETRTFCGAVRERGLACAQVR